MNSKLLENLDLNKNEAEIYLVLIKIGSSSVTEIAKKTNIHRVNIYDILEKLQEKGLVASVLKANKKYFEAASPEIIKKLINNKEKEIQKIKSLLPSLIDSYKSAKKKQEVHVFKTSLGLKTILQDILNTRPKEILDFGPTKGLPFFLPVHFQIWESKRIKLKIPMKIITSSQIRKTIPRKKLQEIRFLEKQFNSFSSTVLYNNKISMFMWTEEPIAILIESKELSESYRNYFYSLWKVAKR